MALRECRRLELSNESRIKSLQYKNDGMRAVAILPVIVYHLNGNQLPGGYLGVDIFCAERIPHHNSSHSSTKNQRVDLVGFWSRRILKFNASSILKDWQLLSTLLSFLQVDRIGLRSDLISSIICMGMGFTAEGQSYFEDFESVSYVRHTWSLAISGLYLIWSIAISLFSHPEGPFQFFLHSLLPVQFS